jgi:flagellar biosynthesis chaperone FliJ
MKKTKFSDLIEIEKRKIEALELELRAEYEKIGDIDIRVSQIEEEIVDIEYPSTGLFSAYRQFHIAMHNMKNDIKNLQSVKLSSRSRVRDISGQIREREQELEKWKYLEDDILKKEREKAKKREQREADEVASLIFGMKQREKSKKL